MKESTIQVKRVNGDTEEWVAVKKTIVTVGSVTTIYSGVAPIGTLESEAKWICKKLVIDQTTPGTTELTLTWASANGSVATDLTALSYS